MKPQDLILRCYAEKKDGVWQAFCLDLTLAAEAETVDKAIKKLRDQMHEYLTDALVGQDKIYAAQLLRRRAPPSYFAKYYWIRILNKLHAMKSAKLFDCPIPLKPC